MKRSLLFCLCCAMVIALAGCATTGGGDIHARAGQHATKFKKLSDEEALKIVAAVYNCRSEAPMDMTAKNITLGTYIDDLKKRRSKYLEDSGVFQLSFDREDIKKWTDRQIVETFRALETKALQYERTGEADLREEEKTAQLIRLTAMDAIYREGKRRDLFRNILEASMRALTIAASIAAAMI